MKITIQFETTRKGIYAQTIGQLEAIILLESFLANFRQGGALQFKTKDGVTAARVELTAEDLEVRTLPDTGTNLAQTDAG